MRLKGILFDAGMTLIRPHPSVEAIYARVAAELGVAVESARLGELYRWSFGCYRDELVLDPSLPCSTSAAGDKAMWARITSRILLELGPAGRELLARGWFEETYRRFHSGSAWMPYPETAEVLERLKARGLRLAVVSNFGPYLSQVLADLDLGSHFDSLVVSAEVGFRKPDRAIFEAALKRLGLGPDEVLHVGDSPGEDIAGAEAAGIKSLLIDRERPDPLGLRALLPLVDGA